MPEETNPTPPAEEPATPAPPAAAPTPETPAPTADADGDASVDPTALEAAMTEGAEAAPVLTYVSKGPAYGYYWGTGRRKTAVASVRLREGTGAILVNRKDWKTFFCNDQDRNQVEAPLTATESAGKIDIFVNVKGGGPTGQAGAVKMGLARALLNYDPTMEPALRTSGLLTRDSRMKERKKPGQRGARRKFQFSKR